MAGTPNPYERCEARPLSGDAHQRAFDRPNAVDHRGLTLADLDRLVRLKVDAARRDGDEAAYLRERAGRQEAQRDAWDDGHSAGESDGRQEMRSAYDRLCGELVHDLHQKAVDIADAENTAAGEKTLTKAALIDFAVVAAKATDRLLVLHREELARIAAGSPEELPF